ncbi:hypothetical protein [Bacillus sp. NEAU-Y102]
MNIAMKLVEFARNVKWGILNPGDTYKEDAVEMIREVHDELNDLNTMKVAVIVTLEQLGELGNKGKTISDLARMLRVATESMKTVVGLEYENHTEINLVFQNKRYRMCVMKNTTNCEVRVYTLDGSKWIYREILNSEVNVGDVSDALASTLVGYEQDKQYS